MTATENQFWEELAKHPVSDEVREKAPKAAATIEMVRARNAAREAEAEAGS